MSVIIVEISRVLSAVSLNMFKKCVFCFREERDLKIALELAEQLAKKKQTNEIGIKTNLANSRPGILKKQYQPEDSARR